MEDITIYDIAKKAGVSAATVSRVINNYEHVRPVTREKVLRIISESNFVINNTARSLSTQSTRIIGILIADIRTTQHTDAIYHFTHEFYNHGYACLIYNTGSDPAKQAEFIQLLSTRKIEAVVMIGSIFQNDEVSDAVKKYIPDIPVGMCNGFLDLENVYSVVADERGGVRDCVRLLASKGYRNIVYISNNITPSNALKIEGFKDGIRECFPSSSPSVVVSGEEIPDVCRSTFEIINNDADAIIYSEDNLALIGLHCIVSSGRRIPEDVAVIGINNSRYSRISNPSLTSLDNMLQATSFNVVDKLLSVLQGGSADHLTVLEPEIVKRDSTGR